VLRPPLEVQPVGRRVRLGHHRPVGTAQMPQVLRPLLARQGHGRSPAQLAAQPIESSSHAERSPKPKARACRLGQNVRDERAHALLGPEGRQRDPPSPPGGVKLSGCLGLRLQLEVVDMVPMMVRCRCSSRSLVRHFRAVQCESSASQHRRARSRRVPSQRPRQRRSAPLRQPRAAAAIPWPSGAGPGASPSLQGPASCRAGMAPRL
jgi:hypothetical protein